MDIRILIIEDEKDHQEVMRRFLEDAGYSEILFADDGEQGVKMAELSKPDLVIIDTILPGIDGFEACRQIRRSSGVEIKLIVVTSRIDAVDAETAKTMGADDYCAKAGNGEAIVRAVNQLMLNENY